MITVTNLNKKVIRVKTTRIEITPYEPGQSTRLEKLLSIYDKLYFRYIPMAFDYDSNRSTLRVPRSISINYLEKEFEGYNIIIEQDKNDPIDNALICLKTQPRDTKQIDAISFLLGIDKYSAIKKYSKALLELDTGIGKTYCAIAAVCFSKQKAGIILGTKGLIVQWMNALIEYTDLSKYDIRILEGSKSIDTILTSDKKIKEKIFLISNKTVQAYAAKHGWKKIDHLFKKLKIGIKIVDECHKDMQMNVMIDLHSNTRRTIYLTATAMRSSEEENFLYKILFSRVPVMKMIRTKEEAYTITQVIRYKSDPDYRDLCSFQGVKGMKMPAVMNYTIFGKGRVKFFNCLKQILDITLPADGKIAILVLIKAATWEIKKYIENHYSEYKDDIGIYTSEITDAKERKEALTKKVIITTSKSMGTGMDIKDLRYLVMCEPYSSEVTARQVRGRLRDIGGKVYYFEIVDFGIKKCVNQFNKRKRYIAEMSKEFKIYDVY